MSQSRVAHDHVNGESLLLPIEISATPIIPARRFTRSLAPFLGQLMNTDNEGSIAKLAYP